MMMIAAGIEEAAIQEGGTTFIPRTALSEALYAVDFAGITGQISCNETGDCQQTATMAIFVVENGDFSADPVFSVELNLADYL
jgi:ABC-type branched-subunit amino acid transport system substrate-binding protein